MNAGRTNVVLSKCGGAIESGGTGAASSLSATTTTTTSSSSTTTTNVQVSHISGSSVIGGYQLPIAVVPLNQSHHHHPIHQQQHPNHHHQQQTQNQLDNRIINQMHRRQSLDKGAILSPPAPFLTPSPSPSIPASPRLQPSPSISPFQQDVLLHANNSTITNTTQEHDRKAATPGRRPSVQGQLSSSPNAGTIVFRPSPTQSPASAQTTVIIGGATGHEINTTQVGSNNISLQNKKNGKRVNNSNVHYNNHHGVQHVNMVASSPKGASKKMLSSMNSPIASPSPVPSPNGATLRPPTPQPQQLQHHHLQHQPQIIQQYPTTMLNANNQIVQIIQTPTILSPPPPPHQQTQYQGQTQRLQHTSHQSANSNSSSSKQNKAPQQILPKPPSAITSSSYNQTSTGQSTIYTSSGNKTILAQQKNHQHLSQQSSIITTAQQQQQQQQHQQQHQQQQQTRQGAPIMLPTGSLNHQPLLLNQMPMFVQQNTPQGVQLILRQPQQQPQLTTQGLMINTRPQLQPQQTQPQLLRILNTNGQPMQLAGNTPTFIVSSQANLIHHQQNMQTIKTASPITHQIQTLSNQQPQLATTMNGQFGINRGMTQIQNVQLNGNLTHIQMPNGLNGQIFSQLPPNFQQQLASYNPNINFNQLSSANFQQIAAAAAAASGATFQSPPPAQTGDMVVTAGGQNIQFAPSSNSGQMSVTTSIPSSPIMTHGGHLLPSGTPEPRQPTPITLLPPNTVVIQDTKTSPASTPTMHMMEAPLMSAPAQSNVTEPTALPLAPPPQAKTQKKPKKPRAKKPPPIPKSVPSTQLSYLPTTCSAPIQTASMVSSSDSSISYNTQSSYSSAATSPTSSNTSNTTTTTSTGKLDLANVMKLCGIMEDDDFMDNDEILPVAPQQSAMAHESMMVVEEQHVSMADNPVAAACPDIMVTIPYSHNTDVPYSFTIPATSASAVPIVDTAEPISISVNTKISNTATENGASQHNASASRCNSTDLTQQFTIKIDHNDSNTGGFPLTISIPRISDTTSTTTTTSSGAVSTPSAMAASMCVPSFVNSVLNSTVTPTLQSQINEIQNQLMGVGSLSEPSEPTTIVSPISSSNNNPMTITTTMSMAQSSNTTAPQSTVKITPTTAPIKPATTKPPRKRPAKKNGKKLLDTIATGNVPSQIGNIQISQVDTSKVSNAGMHAKVAATIENQIQITPIIDSKAQMPGLSMQMNQFGHTANTTNQPSNLASSDSGMQSIQIQATTSHTSQLSNNNQQPQQQIISQNAAPPSTQAAQAIPQLTGSLSLSLVEDGRLILRHNPNQPQDAQSQMILQAILSGALCNVTLINEPMVEKNLSHAVAITPTPSVSVNSSSAQPPQPLNKYTNSSTTVNHAMSSNPTRISTVVSTTISTTTTTTNASSMAKITAPYPQSPQHGGDPNNTNGNAFHLQQLPTQHSQLMQPPQSQPQPESVKHVVQNNPSQTIQINPQKASQKSTTKSQQQSNSNLHAPTTQTTGQTHQNSSNSKKDGHAPGPPCPKFIELPKIDPNHQQLFSLNTITNQITQLNPALTTASLGPMERLLIVPAGINAQQLAQCLLQGQIHFNNIGQASQAPLPNQQPPLQLHQTTQFQVQPSASNKKVQPAAETKPRKSKPRTKKTDAVKPAASVVKTLPKTNTIEVNSPKPMEIDTQRSVVQMPRTSAGQPIQFSQNGPHQNVQIVRPILTQNVVPSQSRNINNHNQPLNSSATANNVQRLPVVQLRPNLMSQNPQNAQINHSQSNGPNMIAPPVSAVQPLVNVHPIPQQHTGSQSQQTNPPRVQTIQLTPQKQQLLKNVQMQIQSLSARLQNKSLLSTLTIPPDFDLNNPIHNKPLPLLSNMNAMTDADIHQALQRLFIEQQKILATGKVIAPMNNPSPTYTTNAKQPNPAQSPNQFATGATNNTLPMKAAAQSTPAKPKATKSRAKIKLPEGSTASTTTKGAPPITILPQSVAPILANRPATIRMATIPVHHVDAPKNVPPNNASNQNRMLPYLPQATNTGASQQTLPQSHYPVQMVSPCNQVMISNAPAPPRMMQPSTLTIVPTQAIAPSPSPSQVRLQNPSQVTMTLHPATATKSVIHLPETKSMQLPSQPKQQPNKTLSAQQKSHHPASNQQMSMRPAMSITTTITNVGQTQLVYQNRANPPLKPISDNQKSLEPTANKPHAHPQQLPFKPQLQQQPTLVLIPTQNPAPKPQPSIQPQLLSPQPTLAAPSVTVEPVPSQNPPMTNILSVSEFQVATDDQTIASPAEPPCAAVSPKMKLPRHCLFERQFEVDQESCRNPDYQSPFQSKEDAVKRLIRYHALYVDDEKPNPEDEEYFQRTADGFPGNFQTLLDNFQMILLKESTLEAKTSELMMLEQMFASDVKEEIQTMQDYINHKPPLDVKIDVKSPIQSPGTSRIFVSFKDIKPEVIKEELKLEPSQSEPKLSSVMDMLVDSLSPDSKPKQNNNFAGVTIPPKNQHSFDNIFSHSRSNVKKESFDIETEIAQCVIMKKNNNNTSKDISLVLPSFQSHQHLTNSPTADLSIDYLCSSSSGSASKRKHIGDDDENASSSTGSKEPYDEWLCIQKELSMMAEKRIELNAATSNPISSSTSVEMSSGTSHPRSTSGHDIFFNSKHDMDHFIGNAKQSAGSDSPLSHLFNTDSLSVDPTNNFDSRKVGHNRIDNLLESRLDDLFTGSPSSLTDAQKHHGSEMGSKLPSRSNEDDWISQQPLQQTVSQDSSKLHWSASEMLSSSSVSPSSTTQFSSHSATTTAKRSSCIEQQSTIYHEEEHSNNRWMMDCAQPSYDFASVGSTDNMPGTKRSWPDSIDQLSTAKKMCFGNLSTSDRDLLGSPTSLLNQSNLHHNTLEHNLLMNHINNGSNHTSDGSSFADVLQSLGAGQIGGANANSNTSLMSNFDDDINRHVQNAIDSILNLQNNEADTMHFPMDPAMASFLAENSPHHSHHQVQNQHLSHMTGGNHLGNHSLNHMHMQHSVQRSSHLGMPNKRRLHNRIDDISDCLISGGGADSNGAGGIMMMDSPGSSDHVGGGVGGNGASEFNIAGGIDEAIKSIITS